MATYNEIGWIYNQSGEAYASDCSALYRMPGWTYNEVNRMYRDCGQNPTGLRDLQMRARILAVGTGSLEMQARISGAYQIQIRGNIVRRQGWPIPDVNDPGINGFTDTRLLMLARIQGAEIGNQNLRMRGRIKYGAVVDLQMRARIVQAATIQMRAMISGQKSSMVIGKFNVIKAMQKMVVGSFFVPGWYTRQSLQVGARIVKRRQAMVNGYFSVVQPSTAKVQTFQFDAATRGTQTLRIGAGIVKN